MVVPRAAWTRFIRPENLNHYAFRMGLTLASVAVFWSASSTGYYALGNKLGLESGYNEASFSFFIYYLLWTGIALFWFRKALFERLTQTNTFANLKAMLALMAVCVLFVTVFLPSLPPVSMWRAPLDPPEFMFASGWYYLPKSADILFQQVLLASIIYTASGLKFRLITVSIGLSIVFGAFHLLLALDGFSPYYVIRFTAAASLFGLIAPYIYLRLQNGFLWAYGLHWSFYAVDATITHLLLAVPKWMNF
ncbi:hypothetical protein LCGC14_1257320 [marine sediment metagenome]|uniref:CPBP family intramembrane metalloprotease n=1 Tax=marine sediment metagenome TaxID=412755 RepID=A0A0F9NID5_9ZZZZ